MIERLILKKVGPHKHTVLNFHKYVNVIVGTTDSGKSAIERGIDLVTNNQPAGNEMKSWEYLEWEGNTSSELIVDGVSVSRIKDPKDMYKLGDAEFVSFGRGGVPDPIKELLNWEELNYQKQIDSHFLLNNTSGQVATFLNKIANIEKIDICTQGIKKELNGTKSSIAKDEQSLKEKQEALGTFAGLAKLAKELERIEEKATQLERLESEVMELNYITHSITLIEESEVEGNAILKHEKSVNAIFDEISDKEKLIKQKQKLSDVLESLKDIEEEIEENTTILKVEPTLSSVLSDIEKQSDLNAELAQLDSLLSKSTKSKKQLKLALLKCEEKENLYNKEFAKLKICPTCNQKIN